VEKENIIKIAVVGPESTGKSTLTKQLAESFATSYVAEYARSYFNEHSIDDYTLYDLEIIYREQLKLEAGAITHAKQILFTDTALISGKVWALEVFNQLPPVLSSASFSENPYHFYLLCDIDLPWEKDEQRKNAHNREHLFNRHLEELKAINAPYSVVRGFNEERLSNALNAVHAYLKTIV